MKKFKIAVAAILLAGSSMTFTSCIGSFAAFHKVLEWNQGVGDKWVNELVFICLNIVPVYSVAITFDTLILNTIEFWTGSNPMQAYEKTVKTDKGTYLVKCDGKGYEIKSLTTGEELNLAFDQNTKTWSVVLDDNTNVPFMTVIDDNHVKMATADGGFTTVELSEQGVMAYSQSMSAPAMAVR